MKKLLLYCLLSFISLKSFSQESSDAVYIDSLAHKHSKILLAKIDTGLIERVHHKVYVSYSDVYRYDSVSRDLMSFEHVRDSIASRLFVTFYYNKGEIIKIDYQEYEMDDIGVAELYRVFHYYKNGRMIESNTVYSHPPKNFRPLSPKKLYEMGKYYFTFYNTTFK
jgi:hypothetical protein